MSWKPHNFRVPERSRFLKEIMTEEFIPDAELAPYVDCLWSMKWDLPAKQEITSLVLPSGCINLLVFTHVKNLALIHGAMTKARPFSMMGKGQIIGVRFRPGGFFPFYGKSVSELTNQAPTFESIYGQAGEDALEAFFLRKTLKDQLDILSRFLSRKLNKRWAENFSQVSAIFNGLAAMENVTKISDMFVGIHASERSQQRLFERMVGMSPKAVLRIHRFQSVLNRLIETGETVNWAELAAESGYYDQAHFVNDFGEITGRRPTEFSQYNEKMSDFSNTRHESSPTVAELANSN